MINRKEQEKSETRSFKELEVFHRAVDFNHDGIGEGPRFHPFIKDWKANYYELINRKGRIVIGVGKLENMSGPTVNYLKNSRHPDKTINVEPEKFIKAVEAFKKKHEGKKYRMLDFRTNCIGFLRFVIKNSKV